MSLYLSVYIFSKCILCQQNLTFVSESRDSQPLVFMEALKLVSEKDFVFTLKYRRYMEG